MCATKHQIRDSLIRMGIRNGDHLAVGVSFRSLGPVDGGPETFIDALIDTVGPDGTVMMNTHTRFFNPAEIRLGWTDYVFDVSSTPCITGAVAEQFRRKQGARRSRHPTFSIAAIGKYAGFLVDEHDENAEAYLPFKKLSEIGGKYLAAGIGFKLAGFRHCAQQSAGLLDVVQWKRAVRFKDRSGIIQTFILKDRGGCTRRLPELVERLSSQGLVTQGKLGEAASIVVPVREALESMTAVLKEQPELNICADPVCYWCRELERRLNLYRKIENPRIFQKNRLLVFIFALMNHLRERDNRVAVKIKILLRDWRKKSIPSDVNP